MNRDPTSLEEIPSRDEVIDVWRKISQRGISHPEDLDQDDPEVIEAEHVLSMWRDQGQQRVEGKQSTSPETLEWSVELSTIYVDAGFHNPEYLEEVVADFLANELTTAEEQGLDEVAAKIRSKIAEIENILGYKIDL